MFNGYRTIIAAVVTMTPAIANLLGFETAPGFSEQATDLIENIITVGGAVLAIYFRLIATIPGWFAKKN